jgi:hypothetical protein
VLIVVQVAAAGVIEIPDRVAQHVVHGLHQHAALPPTAADPPGAGTDSVAIGDLNADGKPDLAPPTTTRAT